MMMLDHGDPAHVAVETEFVALVAEVLRGAKADTPAMMQGTAEAYDPLSHDSAPAFRRALNGPSREKRQIARMPGRSRVIAASVGDA